eukprot:1000309_1
MSQLQRDLFRFTPSNITNNEINGIVDFSSIIDKYDTYAKGNSVTGNEFAFDNLQLRMYCHPKGMAKNPTSEYMSLFIDVLNCTENDKRQLNVSIALDNKVFDFARPVHTFKGGQGPVRWKPYSAVQKCPIAHISIKFVHDPLLLALHSSDTFEVQLAKVHKLSELDGDVTLLIKLPQNNDSNSNNYLYSPSKKKRKLNDPYKCSVCNKEFQSEHGLKIHQSNKKDEAHKNYKNNNDDMNDSDTGLGSNDHEIKFSSLILRSASKVFERMLDTNRLEKQEKRIGIEVRSVDDIKAFTYFMSTNMLKSDCNPWNILELAHYYEMNRLFQQCVDRIINNITIQNFPQTINVFDKFQIETGYQKLIQFAKQNFDELKKAPGFDTIPHSFKCCIPCCVPVLNNQ